MARHRWLWRPEHHLDIVGKELAHLVVPEGDVASFANVVATRLGTSPDRRAVAMRVRQRVVENFSLTGMMDQYERVYWGDSEG